MENEPIAPTAQTTEPTEPVVKPETVNNPEAVLAKNRELLAKQSQIKSELETLREFKKSQELKVEEEKGNYQGVIKSLRDELADIKGARKVDLENRAFETFESRIKDAAKTEGCVNPDKLMKLMTEDQLKSVQIMQDNGKFEVHMDDVKRLMDVLKEEHKDINLFRNPNIQINTVGGGFAPTVKTTNELSKEEIINRLKNLN